MAFLPRDNEEINPLIALVREPGQPLPHSSQQQLFPERPGTDTQNCAFVSATFRHLDHIPNTNQDDHPILVEDDNGDLREPTPTSKGEHLRTVLKGMFKQGFWINNMHPGPNCHVLNKFIEGQKCLFCNTQYNDDARPKRCVYRHVNLNPQ
ncbi:hypothetical protein FRC19_005064 [Serendipita sp. 401]|nr:hypothetical protein FRC19_005064 [Serendipita sp. 401]KAG8856983.1 hypothetical protein FRC20_000384 [Serendipita sp. 405]KAG9031251.1 hypothetical protein FS842_004279 [Serendipita sp. 407]